MLTTTWCCHARNVFPVVFVDGLSRLDMHPRRGPYPVNIQVFVFAFLIGCPCGLVLLAMHLLVRLSGCATITTHAYIYIYT